MEKGKRKAGISAREMTLVALSAVVLIICSWITIPVGAVPFTLQTFGVFLLTALLGAKLSSFSFLLYILLGLVGLPVFSGFRAGPAVLFGATGGYLIGFFWVPLLYALAVRMFERKPWAEFLGLFLGDVCVFVFGTAWFMRVYLTTSGAVTPSEALAWCVWPFLVPDLVKLFLALALALRLRPLLRLPQGRREL